MKRLTAALLVFVLWIGSFGTMTLKAEERTAGKNPSDAGVEITAPSAVLMEGSTGTVLYEKDSHKQRMPASITKIMTLLLAFEALEQGKIKLDDEVSVSEHAASMGGSQVFLEPNETQTVETMIKCISIASANDASVAMAEYIAGSEEEFVKRMNEKAQALGMKDTHFLNCCGLDDDITSGHYSSAYDIALMSRELITRFPQISEYSTIWMDTITHVTRKGESQFGLTNTNKLVRTYNGITGLKTGSTSKAKYCLSATARRDGMDLIAVVMAAPEPKARFQDAAKLLDYGFANLSLYTDEQKDLEIPPVPVKKGVVKTIGAKPAGKYTYVCMKGVDPSAITREVQIKEEITAPIKAGEEAGAVVYSLNGKEIGRVPLLTEQGVDKAKFGHYLVRLVNQYFMKHE